MFLSGIQSKDKKMSKLWGGRFSKDTDKLVEQFTRSIEVDYKLAKYDILGSIAHITVLHKSGYLNNSEYDQLKNALEKIFKDIHSDKYKPDFSCEDVHTDIQKKLEVEVKELVLKLHTARSRNDQVVFATKFYIKDELIVETQAELKALINAITNLGSTYSDIIIPGFTHLQHAQPVYLKDYLFAYIEMFVRDTRRLQYISDNMKITMGAGALAGTPIDAKTYSVKAEDFFVKVKADKWQIHSTENSLDSVSDRDFVIEVLSALSIVAMHLSRLAEDLIIWSTKEFDFIEIDDAFCTGSSLMPQKKNPDVLELVRGNTGRLYGNLMNVLTMMKGLPLTYNRDMQLDKEPLFDSFETISIELRVLKGLVETLKFNKDKIEEHLNDESLYATDLVYYLIKKGIPFKKAHTIVGELAGISSTAENKISLKTLFKTYIKDHFKDSFNETEINSLFEAKTSVESKKSIKRNSNK